MMGLVNWEELALLGLGGWLGPIVLHQPLAQTLRLRGCVIINRTDWTFTSHILPVDLPVDLPIKAIAHSVHQIPKTSIHKLGQDFNRIWTLIKA